MLAARFFWLIVPASLSLVAHAASASDGHCPRNGGTLCNSSRDQLQLTADGVVFELGPGLLPTTEMFVAWRDVRDSATTGADIYLAEAGACVDSTSAPGVPVCIEPGAQERPFVAISGYPPSHPFPGTPGFGIIVAWQDGRSGVDLDVYARSLDGYPSAPWNDAGIPICAAAGDQAEVVVTGSGYGGAIFAWIDRRSGESDLYAQRADSLGAMQWAADGIPFCTAAGEQSDLRIVSDGDGGAFLLWIDHREADAIYSTHLLTDGTLATGWNPDGNRVSGSPSVPADLFPVPDGSGGVFVFWTDTRDDSGGDVYGQHFLTDGSRAAGWTAGGLSIAAGPVLQTASDAVADGSGNAYCVWVDEAAVLAMETEGDANIMAQLLATDGEVVSGWPAGGRVVCDAPGRQEHARVSLSDYDRGVIVIWSDRRNGAAEADLYGLRLHFDGSITNGWVPNGTVISGAPDVQDLPVVVTAEGGGARVAWIDYRDRATSAADVYSAGVTYGGLVDAPARVSESISLGAAHPNPATGKVSFTLELASENAVEAEVVDLAGRRVFEIGRARYPAGHWTLVWNGRDENQVPVRPGVFFMRVRVGHSALVRRFIRLD